MTDAVLALEDVTYRYAPDRPLAIDGVSLAIGRGEVVGVIGPNGAGKSTLARLACGLLAPSSGVVRVGGEDVRAIDRATLARKIAVVPQHGDAAFDITARDVVRMGRAPHTGFFGLESKEDRAVADEALAACEASALAERAFTTLSGGEQKRVTIARAFAQAAPVLVLDEPTAFLDLHHQVGILDLVVKRVERDGVAALVVLHDLNLAAQFCTRLLLLAEGRTVATGPVADVLTYRRVKETFGVEVWVGVNELSGARYFVPTRK